MPYLAHDLQQMPTCCKLSPPGYRHLTMISATLEYTHWCHRGTNVQMPVVTVWRSGAYHLLPMHHVLSRVRI